ncbi:glucosylceramidase [Pedobacter sp. HMF7647]|uniref:Glucosylceramidase n=1 Tax=Hufsiella arboris TaxID=2695275 RepID=A0A7K1Y6G5_9SPHI|nr:glycoside hydrolase family 30 beta sandwich domain-containing protein [Hufsiella arboris]MXV50153.1 glucosylceramidase [Hufsiella arboris]
MFKKNLLLAGLALLSWPAFAQENKLTYWLTDPANNILFKKETLTNDLSKSAPTITIDVSQKYQSIDGFGFALTSGSTTHLMNMSPAKRSALLHELFSVDGSNIGTSYLRISIGASDLSDHVFTYDDMPDGNTDEKLEHFDLGPDKTNVIPALKEILAINPSIKILGSPWSPPSWMKTNNDSRGGMLKPEYYETYAQYFVKYIQQMKAAGIRIDAITIQNEPLHPGNNPSLLMPAPDQAEFIKNHLGPAFEKNHIDAKIIIYDHNADRPDYPILILSDPKAAKYIDGSAFHLYGGKIEALSDVHNAFPNKNIYFTEQWVGAPGNLERDLSEHIKNLVIGATRNWSHNVIEWNLAADPENKPYTDRGGCDRCLGAITIDKDEVKRNPAYYVVAHSAKFVRPGSVRVASNEPDSLPNVAFKTASGKTVLIVLNTAKASQTFNIQLSKNKYSATLNAGAVATYIF